MTGPLVSLQHVIAVLNMAGLEDDPVFVAVQELPTVEVPTRTHIAAFAGQYRREARFGMVVAAGMMLDPPRPVDYAIADAILALLTPEGAGEAYMAFPDDDAYAAVRAALAAWRSK